MTLACRARAHHLPVPSDERVLAPSITNTFGVQATVGARYCYLRSVPAKGMRKRRARKVGVRYRSHLFNLGGESQHG